MKLKLRILFPYRERQLLFDIWIADFLDVFAFDPWAKVWTWLSAVYVSLCVDAYNLG
jgi:hypothetical protein